MANIQERRGKDGKLVSYSIRVHRGRSADGRQLKPWATTYKVEPTWSEKTAKKKATAFAANFEKACREGQVSDSRQRFQDYAEYVLRLKEQRGDKRSTLEDYRQMTRRIYPEIGHLKLSELKPKDLNLMYEKFQQDGMNQRTGDKLSPTTINRYHRFISIVLAQAVREQIILTNAASLAEPPRKSKVTPNCVTPEEYPAILAALETEPEKWRMAITLLIATGCRRGELFGLRWQDIDLDRQIIHICNEVLYSPRRGLYETTPKTQTSDRYLDIDAALAAGLRTYKAHQAAEILEYGAAYQRRDFVFAQPDGSPMHPDSLNTWLSRFCKRHGLRHLNPHSFRHGNVTFLISEGIDVVTASHRAGHSRPSTTANIYAHPLEKRNRECAELIGQAMKKQA